MAACIGREVGRQVVVCDMATASFDGCSNTFRTVWTCDMMWEGREQERSAQARYTLYILRLISASPLSFDACCKSSLLSRHDCA